MVQAPRLTGALVASMYEGTSERARVISGFQAPSGRGAGGGARTSQQRGPCRSQGGYALHCNIVQGHRSPSYGTSSANFLALEQQMRNRFVSFSTQTTRSSGRPIVTALSDKKQHSFALAQGICTASFQS
ncbi:hypothetical protein PoB_003617500 [Plakobranchus ocellatus]|uniref:Uncharacterized protein n=1 Tax=Plakobranchus ocellatus TaxID=259542 RepID=A0AAV4AN68_9GAST|nr:hypothetical protein PoB_003617500 [Plakobranchus ocellatus]